MRRSIIAGAIVVAGLATAGIAYAENQPPDPSLAVAKAAATGAPAPAAAGGKAGILKGAIHGDLLVRGKDGSTHTVTFDRGKVSSLSASSITIQRPDGVSVTDDLTDQTVFNGMTRDQIKTGTPAIVVSEGHTATHVVTRGARAEAVAKACANPPADGGNGLRARMRERICQRLEQRQQRRAGKGQGAVGAGQNGAQGGPAAGSDAGQGSPTAGPSSMVGDGSKTIVS
jgi:hypothetical protein